METHDKLRKIYRVKMDECGVDFMFGPEEIVEACDVLHNMHVVMSDVYTTNSGIEELLREDSYDASVLNNLLLLQKCNDAANETRALVESQARQVGVIKWTYDILCEEREKLVS